MRKIVVFLLVCALALALALPGCGPKAPADEGPLGINPDGTVGLLRWGMTKEEAAKADRRIVFTPDPASAAVVCDVAEFLGHPVQLVLRFAQFPQEGDYAPDRLVLIRAFLFLEKGEPDYIPIVGAYFTEGKAELSYGSGGWSSDVTLEDLVPREKLEALYPEGVENGRTAEPLWRAAALSTRGPADAGGIPARTGDREFSYSAMGYAQVLAEILGKG